MHDRKGRAEYLREKRILVDIDINTNCIWRYGVLEIYCRSTTQQLGNDGSRGSTAGWWPKATRMGSISRSWIALASRFMDRYTLVPGVGITDRIGWDVLTKRLGRVSRRRTYRSATLRMGCNLLANREWAPHLLDGSDDDDAFPNLGGTRGCCQSAYYGSSGIRVKAQSKAVLVDPIPGRFIRHLVSPVLGWEGYSESRVEPDLF